MGKAIAKKVAIETAASTPAWGAAICNPVALSAVFVTAINDHWLKRADVLPSFVTGKLSDICGLFFFPLLVVSILRGVLFFAGRNPPPSKIVHSMACVSTALVFAWINISPALNGFVESFRLRKVMDPTDLLAIPIIVASWFFLEKTYGNR